MNPSGIAVLASHRIAGGGGGSFQLQDLFNGSSRNTTTWQATERVPYGLAGLTLAGSDTETAGAATISPTNTGGVENYVGRASSSTSLTLVGKEMVVWLSSFSTGGGVSGFFEFSWSQTATRSGNTFRWSIENDFGTVTLRALYNCFGSTGTVFSATYSATDHAWLRMRESGGDIYWDTAPNSGGVPGTWVNRRQRSVDGGTPADPFTPDAGDVGAWVRKSTVGTAPSATISEFWVTA